MAKPIRKRTTIALKTPSGTFEETDIDSEPRDDEILTNCPETGINLANVGPAKHAAQLWPTLNPRALPDSEAGKRYQLLLDEQARRDEQE